MRAHTTPPRPLLLQTSMTQLTSSRMLFSSVFLTTATVFVEERPLGLKTENTPPRANSSCILLTVATTAAAAAPAQHTSQPNSNSKQPNKLCGFSLRCCVCCAIPKRKSPPKGNDRTRQHKAQGEELEKRQGQRGQRDRETREKERTNKAKALLLATLVAAS